MCQWRWGGVEGAHRVSGAGAAAGGRLQLEKGWASIDNQHRATWADNQPPAPPSCHPTHMFCCIPPPTRPPSHPAAGGDGGALGIVSNGVVRFQNCAFYDNFCEWGSGGASECAELAGRSRAGKSNAAAGLLGWLSLPVPVQTPPYHARMHACTHVLTTCCSVPPCIAAVSTSAETWFVNCKFERNIVGQNGGAVLLEGGCPAGYFIKPWFKVGGTALVPAGPWRA